MLADDDRLWILVQNEDSASHELRDLRSDAQAMASAEDLLRLHLDADDNREGQAVAMAAWPDQDRPAVLSRRSVMEPADGGWKRWQLAAALDPFGQVALADQETFFVGYNRGEWGGGLRRIDVADGAISLVREQSDELCGGAINPACSPVVGLFGDPDRPGCVMVGTGLSHMGLSHGHIYRVCGSTIAPVFSTPVPAEGARWMLMPQPWPLHGFVEAPGGWIGLSRDRYFRSEGGDVVEHPMPEFRDWSGIRISEEQNSVLFVVAACCWGSADHPTLYRALAIPIRP